MQSDQEGQFIVGGELFPKAGELTKLDGEGRLVWNAGLSFSQLVEGVVSSVGDIYAWGWDFSSQGPPYDGPVLARFDSNGKNPAVIASGSDQSSIGPVAAGSEGGLCDVSAAGISSAHPGSAVHYLPAAGEPWALDNGPPQGDTPNHHFPIQFQRCAIDAQGNLVVAGYATDVFTVNTSTFGSATRKVPVMMKLSRTGLVLWAQQLAGADGSFWGLGLSAKGTVVASGVFKGEFLWNGATLFHPSNEKNSAAFLLTVEADGTPRWAKQLDEEEAEEGSTVSGPGYLLSVDPAGEVALAGGAPGCQGTRVLRYNLAGDSLWTRVFQPIDCNGLVLVKGIAVWGEDVVLSGGFRGAVDFGTGVKSSPPDLAQNLLSGFVLYLDR